MMPSAKLPNVSLPCARQCVVLIAEPAYDPSGSSNGHAGTLHKMIPSRQPLALFASTLPPASHGQIPNNAPVTRLFAISALVPLMIVTPSASGMAPLSQPVEQAMRLLHTFA